MFKMFVPAARIFETETHNRFPRLSSFNWTKGDVVILRLVYTKIMDTEKLHALQLIYNFAPNDVTTSTAIVWQISRPVKGG